MGRRSGRFLFSTCPEAECNRFSRAYSVQCKSVSYKKIPQNGYILDLSIYYYQAPNLSFKLFFMPIEEAIHEMEGKISLLDNKKFVYTMSFIGVYYLLYLGLLAYTILVTA